MRGVRQHSWYFWPVFLIRPVGVVIYAGKADPHVGLEAACLISSAVEVGLLVLLAGGPTEASVTHALEDRIFAWPINKTKQKKMMIINFCSPVTKGKSGAQERLKR